MQKVGGHSLAGKFRAICAAEKNSARLAEPRDRNRILGRNEVSKQSGTVRRRSSAEPEVVLGRYRDAEPGTTLAACPAAIGPACLVEHKVRIEMDQRVKRGIYLLNMGDERPRRVEA